jgi:hypothetical protein
MFEFRVRPLVQALVHPVPVVDPLSDSCEVSDYDRSDPSFVEGLRKPRRDFMQEILDLVADLRELPVFGSGQPFPTPASFVFPVDLRPQGAQRSVVLPAERPEPPAVNTDVFSTLNVDRRKMLLAKVDAHLRTPPSALRLLRPCTDSEARTGRRPSRSQRVSVLSLKAS